MTRPTRGLGWTTVLATETDRDPDVVILLENLQQVDLSPIEEARGLQRKHQDLGGGIGGAAPTGRFIHRITASTTQPPRS